MGEVREAYDVAEVQDCHSQLRMCMQRISDVEAINVDLESRLEAQAREYIDLESDAADSRGGCVNLGITFLRKKKDFV